MTMAYTIGSAVGGAAAGFVKTMSNSGSGSESQTRMDHESTLWNDYIKSRMWRDDTNWYNNNIVSSAYSRARQSLEDAGYNPLMALNNGGLYDQAPMQNGSVMKSSAKDISWANSQERLSNAEMKRIDSETKLNSAKAKTEQYNQDLLEINKSIADIDKQLKEKDLKWYDREKLETLKNVMEDTKYKTMQAYASGVEARTTQMLGSANFEFIKEQTEGQKTSNAINKAQQQHLQQREQPEHLHHQVIH